MLCVASVRKYFAHSKLNEHFMEMQNILSQQFQSLKLHFNMLHWGKDLCLHQNKTEIAQGTLFFFCFFFLMQKNESDILQPEPMFDSTSRHKPTSVSVSGALSKYPTQFCTLLQWMVEFSSLCGTTGIPLFRQYSPSLILIHSLSFLLSQSRQKCGFTLNSKLQLIRSLYNL